MTSWPNEAPIKPEFLKRSRDDEVDDRLLYVESKDSRTLKAVSCPSSCCSWQASALIPSSFMTLRSCSVILSLVGLLVSTEKSISAPFCPRLTPEMQIQP